MKIQQKIVVAAIMPLVACCCHVAPRNAGLSEPGKCHAAEAQHNAPSRKGQVPKFFTDNRITEIKYVKVAMHNSNPKPVTIMRVSGLTEREISLLEKADCGAWKREYEDDRIRDGMRWVVEFVSGGKVIKRVDGFNAEPDGLKYLLEAADVLKRQPEFD